MRTIAGFVIFSVGLSLVINYVVMPRWRVTWKDMALGLFLLAMSSWLFVGM